jgi:hypothetical protein
MSIAITASKEVQALVEVDELESIVDCALKAWADAGIPDERLWRDESSRRRMSVLVGMTNTDTGHKFKIVVSAFVSPTLGKCVYLSLPSEGRPVDTSIREGQHRL